MQVKKLHVLVIVKPHSYPTNTTLVGYDVRFIPSFRLDRIEVLLKEMQLKIDDYQVSHTTLFQLLHNYTYNYGISHIGNDFL